MGGKPWIDLTGKTFGRLTVEKFLGRNDISNKREKHWFCRCSCGETKLCAGYDLRQGLNRSCGCLRRETTSITKRKHGMRQTAIYRRWWAMMNRCYLSSCKAYKFYGLRGISVHPKWQNFPGFFEDMGLPGKGLWIERIDNDGHYEPGNCVWADKDEQAKNRRKRRTPDIIAYEASIKVEHKYPLTKKLDSDIFDTNS